MDDMIARQVERRRQRGDSELRRIVNRGAHPVYSTFEVTSHSDRTYSVRIRDLEHRHNTCECPDYRTNLIGTCKHIEGVLSQLRQQHGAKLARLAADRPKVTQVYLHHGEEVTVRLAAPRPEKGALRLLLDRYFDAEGVLQGAPQQSVPALLREVELLSPRDRRRIEIGLEVTDHLDLLRDRDAVRRQKDWFLDQIRLGNRSYRVLSAPLFPYQEAGMLHLAFGRRAMLADDMGLGKTVQAIAAAVLLRQLRDVRRVLVVCPASLKHQWVREVERFTDLDAQVIGGPLFERRRQYASPAFFNLVNYEIARRDVDELQRMSPDIVILDEAQRIKNWRTKTADAIKRLSSRYAFVLTGTPMENRIDELYSVFQFLDPRILGPLWQFNERYYDLEQTRRGGYRVLGYKNLDELRGRIAPYVVRRSRAEVLTDLPPRTDNNYFVEITDEQRRAYADYEFVVARLLAKARRMPLSPKEHQILLGSLVKMRLICNALSLHDHTLDEKTRERTAPKLHELRDILVDEVTGNGHKALVFSQWTGMLELVEPIVERLGLGYVKLTGDVPTARRGDLITRFNEDPDCRLFLSTDAGGLGLNLQAASLVINLDLPWNPAVLEQRIGRAHRHGQARRVQVVNLIAQGTIEERLLDSLAAKRNVFQNIFDTDGGADVPSEIAFHDLGPTLLQTLAEIVETPPAPEVTLAPSGDETAAQVPHEVQAEPGPEVGSQRMPSAAAAATAAAATAVAATAAAATAATAAAAAAAGVETLPHRERLAAFADQLVARFPGRILLVRAAPAVLSADCSAAVLVVVDADPATLRSTIEVIAEEHWPGGAATLHLMEREGYRVLQAMLAQMTGAASEPEADAYRAPSMPRPDRRGARMRRQREVDGALEQAERQLRMGNVLLDGGFPDETAAPLRAALGSALAALMLLCDDGSSAHAETATRMRSSELPSARAVNVRLVESGQLPPDLAARISDVRAMTEPPADGDGAAERLSATAARGLVATVEELLALARERLAKAAIGGGLG